MQKMASIMGLQESISNNELKLIISLPGSDRQLSMKNNHGNVCNNTILAKFNCFNVKYNKRTNEALFESLLDNNKRRRRIYNMLHSLQPIYQKSIENGGLHIHAALIEKDGRGVLLPASSFTGKSTCCGRLPSPWKALCDDESLIVFNKKKGQFYAHPFPTWSDYYTNRKASTWDVQYSVPLEGLFFLKQSDTDYAGPIGEGETVLRMVESSMQAFRRFQQNFEDKAVERRFQTGIFNNAEKISKKVPAFLLHNTINGKFWEEIEGALGW